MVENTGADQVSAISGHDWVADFFADVDRFDLGRLVTWFDDDIEVRFGNAPPTQGRHDSAEAFRAFWASIAGLSHRRDVAIANDDMGMQMSTVTYKLHNGATISVPGSTYLRRVGDKRIDRLWVTVDMAPVVGAI